MSASQHRDRSSALSAFTASGARTFANALLVAKNFARPPIATTLCTPIVATQPLRNEGSTHTSAGSRDLTYPMFPARLIGTAPAPAVPARTPATMKSHDFRIGTSLVSDQRNRWYEVCHIDVLRASDENFTP